MLSLTVAHSEVMCPGVIILYRFIRIFWYVLVKLQEARLAITMLKNSFVSP